MALQVLADGHPHSLPQRTCCKQGDVDGLPACLSLVVKLKRVNDGQHSFQDNIVLIGWLYTRAWHPRHERSDIDDENSTKRVLYSSFFKTV